MEWAEKGWCKFGDSFNRDSELRDFLATEYRRRKRNGDAISLYWNEFAGHPHLFAYQRLKTEASHAKAWPEWREKAFAFIREKIAQSKKKKPEREPYRFGLFSRISYRDRLDNSLLVEILLWEKKPQEAWDEAMAGDCGEE